MQRCHIKSCVKVCSKKIWKPGLVNLLCKFFGLQYTFHVKCGLDKYTQLLLTGLFILFMLGLLVAMVYSMVIMLNAIAKDTQGEQRLLLSASIMNVLALSE